MSGFETVKSWLKKRGNKVPIETHATLPNGKKIKDIVTTETLIEVEVDLGW